MTRLVSVFLVLAVVLGLGRSFSESAVSPGAPPLHSSALKLPAPIAALPTPLLPIGASLSVLFTRGSFPPPLSSLGSPHTPAPIATTWFGYELTTSFDPHWGPIEWIAIHLRAVDLLFLTEIEQVGS